MRRAALLGLISQIVLPAATAAATAVAPPRLVPIAKLAGKVRCVLSDMDGTLLGSDHMVSRRSTDAVKQLRDAGILFFPATGRSRLSVASVTPPEFLSLLAAGDVGKLSGVFSQGLVVAGRDGRIIHEEYLPLNVVEHVEDYAARNGLSLVAYAGDRLLTTKTTEYTNLMVRYKELTPEQFTTSFRALHSQGTALNKIILMGNDQILQAQRATIEAQLQGVAAVTKAVPCMLEVLPLGASKGNGVKILLDHYGVSSNEALAFGDGENDISMFEAVEHNIAVANAQPDLVRYARWTTLANTEHGVATVLEELCRHEVMR